MRHDPNVTGLNLILLDKDLAKLGDSYINFLYSMALTMIHGIPRGVKVSDRILAEAARESGIRNLLPKRTPRGRVADAMESLIVYSLITGHMEFKEMIQILIEAGNPPNIGFARMAKEILRRLDPPENSG
ncbi:MAG: ribonuclease III family protein [Candidatus Bathyarchaeia archaeon]